jgi:hypothetical protein
MRFTHVLGLGALLALSACSRSPSAPTIAVRNESGVALTNMVVFGNGFEQPLGTLPSGATTQLTVHPAGPSALSLRFDGGGQRVGRHSIARLSEGGVTYQVVAVIQPDMQVAISETPHRH